MKAAWHVGDTPYDIKASQVGGAGAIGVLTGVHTLKDLDKAATGVGETLMSRGAPMPPSRNRSPVPRAFAFSTTCLCQFITP